MAKLLIKAFGDNEGDIITIKPDRWVWTKAEQNVLRFRHVDIPDVDYKELIQYLKPIYDSDPEKVDEAKPITKRRYKINTLSEQDRIALESTLTAASQRKTLLKSLIIDKTEL